MREKRQEHDVFLTWEAIYDITDIAEYIEIYFGIEKADCFQQEIREIISDLNIFSLSGMKTYIQYRGYEIYRKNFSPSIIFYIIKDDMVHVLRVLRHEQDWGRSLKMQKKYTYPDGSVF